MIQTEWQERTGQLVGVPQLERYETAHVLVVGVGGVGAYAAEMLVRAGVGKLTIVDADCVQPSNINRQLCALHSTVGRSKTDVLRERFLDINPQLQLTVKPYYLEAGQVTQLLDESHYDFIVDAIDTIAPKCALICEALQRKIPIVCSMGAGAKTDITKVQFADLWETYHCGLSKAVRTRLKKDGVRKKVPVVFSSEQANPNAVLRVDERNKKSTTGTISYMPAVFGCYLAQYVLTRL